MSEENHEEPIAFDDALDIEVKDGEKTEAQTPAEEQGTPAEEQGTPAEEQTAHESQVAEPQETVEEQTADGVVAQEAVAQEAAAEGESEVTFKDFGLCPEIMQALDEAGFKEPTPIQVKAIPHVLAGRDVIGQALTGTGKTAAFGLPIMQMIMDEPGLNMLVLVPTRELAAQVSNELFKLGRYANIHTAAFTGGQSYSRQETMLSKGINALVATPGRLIDLIESGHFDEIQPRHIVVDEADEMLDMGFLDDVKHIFEHFSGEHQTMLFSATMPRPVIQLAATILKDPVNITTDIAESTNNDIEQLFYVIEDSERANAVIRLIDAENVTKGMIFCRTKEETDALNILLSARGYNVNCLHGDMEQAQRSRVMAAFRRGEIDILVATDVAARGLDVDDVSHVFNYHLPFDSRGYVHRIGRTGRAGKTGTAITLVTPRELRQLEAIKKNVGAQIENRLIPSRTEVTENRLKKIFHDIHDYELDVNLLNQVQTLTVNQDMQVLIAKLLTRELKAGGDQGPEHIGIAGPRLARLLTPREKRPERTERGRRFGRRDDRDDRDFRGGRDRDRRGRRGDFDEREDHRERRPRREYDAWAKEEGAPVVEKAEKPAFEAPAPKPAPAGDKPAFEAPAPKPAPAVDKPAFEAPAPVVEKPVVEKPAFEAPVERKHDDRPREERKERHDDWYRDERPREERSGRREWDEDEAPAPRRTRPGNLDRPSYFDNAPQWKKDRDERPRREFGDYEDRPRREFGKRDFNDRDERPRREFGKRDFNDRDERPRREFGDRDGKVRLNADTTHAPRKGKWASKFEDSVPKHRKSDDHKPAASKPAPPKATGKADFGKNKNWYFN